MLDLLASVGTLIDDEPVAGRIQALSLGHLVGGLEHASDHRVVGGREADQVRKVLVRYDQQMCRRLRGDVPDDEAGIVAVQNIASLVSRK